MSRATAVALWGEEVVACALAGPAAQVTADMAADVERQARAHGSDASGLAAWALGLPLPRFCAVVRVVSGVAALDALTGGP